MTSNHHNQHTRDTLAEESRQRDRVRAAIDGVPGGATSHRRKPRPHMTVFVDGNSFVWFGGDTVNVESGGYGEPVTDTFPAPDGMDTMPALQALTELEQAAWTWLVDTNPDGAYYD
jgi:hypothetical protein